MVIRLPSGGGAVRTADVPSDARWHLVPVLTAAENAEFTLMLQKIPKAARRRRAAG